MGSIRRRVGGPGSSTWGSWPRTPRLRRDRRLLPLGYVCRRPRPAAAALAQRARWRVAGPEAFAPCCRRAARRINGMLGREIRRRRGPWRGSSCWTPTAVAAGHSARPAGEAQTPARDLGRRRRRRSGTVRTCGSRRPGTGRGGLDRRHVPVAEVGAQRAAGVELQERLVVESLDVHRLRLDHRHLLGDGADPSRQVSGSFMWYSTPRYSTTSNCPSPSRSTVWKSATTGSTAEPERGRRSRSPAGPGGRAARSPSRRAPGRAACLWDALVPVGAPGDEVHAPGVVVEGDDATGAGLFGGEGVLPVPGADVEHAAAATSGRIAAGSPGRCRPW